MHNPTMRESWSDVRVYDALTRIKARILDACEETASNERYGAVQDALVIVRALADEAGVRIVENPENAERIVWDDLALEDIPAILEALEVTECTLVKSRGYYTDYIERRDIESVLVEYLSDDDTDTELYATHAYLSFGDYDNSCQVERSNVRVLSRELVHYGYGHCLHSGGYGHVEIRLPLESLLNETISEMIASLSDYPVLDDSDLSELEIEVEDAYYEDTLKGELWEELMKTYTARVERMRLDADDRSELVYAIQELEPHPDLYDWFRAACNESGTELAHESGGSVYLPRRGLVVKSMLKANSTQIRAYMLAQPDIRRLSRKARFQRGRIMPMPDSRRIKQSVRRAQTTKGRKRVEARIDKYARMFAQYVPHYEARAAMQSEGNRKMALILGSNAADAFFWKYGRKIQRSIPMNTREDYDRVRAEIISRSGVECD